MGNKKAYRGIDISLYQGEPDFRAVKNAGMDFVILKASQGRTAEYNAPFEDPKFRTNVKRLSSRRSVRRERIIISARGTKRKRTRRRIFL